MISFKQFYESQATDKTVALIPGSFKPMHKAHWAMVDEYSNRADEVIILVSDPKEKVRKTASGKVISAQDAKKIIDIYIKASGKSNVKCQVSPVPSPVTAALEFAEKELKNCKVIFGASKKGGDWKRYSKVKDYYAKTNPTIQVQDPEKSAVDAKFSDMSATDMRNSLDDPEKLKSFLPDFLSQKDIEQVIEILK